MPWEGIEEVYVTWKLQKVIKKVISTPFLKSTFITFFFIEKGYLYFKVLYQNIVQSTPNIA
jgi:hypothetical protein